VRPSRASPRPISMTGARPGRATREVRPGRSR